MAAIDYPDSLTEADASQRLIEVGPNELDKLRSRTLWALVRGALREPMFILLLGAVGLYLVLGDLVEGLFLLGGALVALSLVVAQELRSERALKALRTMAEPYARVIRDGMQRRTPARLIVPGDLVAVGEGERLPADGLLIRGDVLTVDESALTGESVPVSKTPMVEHLSSETGLASKLLAGTLVTAGHGLARITNTGARTEFGQIGASLATLSEEQTPLQRTAGRLVGLLGLAALGFCAVVTVSYGLMRGNWAEGVLAGLTVAIALIPEEFPMVLAVFLAIGAWRLANHKVAVRRSAVIETLGAASVLCVDKTGTLTQNHLRLARLWTDEGSLDPAASGSLAHQATPLIEAAVLASPRHSLDPLDRAILEVAEPRIAAAPLRTWPLCKERLAVVQVFAEFDGQVAAAKGAPETVFRLCRLSAEDAAARRDALDVLASAGYRVLAAASWRGEAFPDAPEEARFVFQGLLAFEDPLRTDVPAALKEAQAAGIAICMITGDYPATAAAIAKQAGIDISAGVVLGSEIAGLSRPDLQARVGRARVFARVQPEQKLKLVEAFKANGDVVAMTGDGVNDAPALEAAHIGIAMGRRGTDVAREAADLVLLDDSFASIVGGVRLGRRIFANLRKALTYLTAIHVPIAGLALAPILLGMPQLLFPMHVVLLELLVDPVCSLVFEGEPSEEGSMQRRPRNPAEKLFGLRLIAFALTQGLVATAAILILYAWALAQGSEAQARGAAFATLITTNLVLAFADSASTKIKLFDARRGIFWIIAATAAGVVAAVLYVPMLQSAFRVTTPSSDLLIVSIAVGAAAGAWFRLVDFGRRRAEGLAQALRIQLSGGILR